MFTKLIKSVVFKPVALLMMLAILFMSFTFPSETVILKSGTVIPLELMTSLSGNEVRNGQIIDFRVVGDIKVNGKTVVAAGSVAQGQVTKAKKNGLFGTAGELSITVKSVRTVDGSMIYLSNSNLNDEGSDKLVVSIVVTLFCLFGFLIKGGKAEIPAGTQCQAIVMSDVEVNVN